MTTAPCAVSPPSMCSAPTILPIVSSLPRPFWNEITTVEGFTTCCTERAAASFAKALHWNRMTSATPSDRGSAVAGTRTERSPPCPTIRSPLRLIASTCSLQTSTSVTSSPPSASRPPKRLPMAPPPTMIVLGLSNLMNDMRVSVPSGRPQISPHFGVGHFLAQIGLDHAMVVLDRRGRALGDLFAVLQHRHDVACVHHDFQDVLDDDQGKSEPVLERHDRLEQLVDVDRRETRGGLVQHQELRPHRHRAP